MKKVYLTVEGMEQIALGREPYSWQFLVLNSDSAAPDGAKLLCELEVTLPPPADCVQPVLTMLKEKENRIQAEAFEELKRVKERREAVLCLPMETTSESSL